MSGAYTGLAAPSVEGGAQDSLLLALAEQGYLNEAARAPINPDTLVAGCGSGRHALLVALRDPSAQVLAIDLSTASLAHATRKALGITNIEFQHMDILNASNIAQRFGGIESSGVLHHMHEPRAGLAALRPLLLEGGVMKLALYRRKARLLVNKARARITKLHLGASKDDVRELRQRILAGLEPELSGLLDSSDFYSESACRDLLFYVQEHQYLAPELTELVSSCELKFLGFYFSSDLIPNRYRTKYPHDQGIQDMQLWDTFEEQYPGTFSECYQFWSQAVAPV